MLQLLYVPYFGEFDGFFIHSVLACLRQHEMLHSEIFYYYPPPIFSHSLFISIGIWPKYKSNKDHVEPTGSRPTSRQNMFIHPYMGSHYFMVVSALHQNLVGLRPPQIPEMNLNPSCNCPWSVFVWNTFIAFPILEITANSERISNSGHSWIYRIETNDKMPHIQFFRDRSKQNRWMAKYMVLPEHWHFLVASAAIWSYLLQLKSKAA